MSKLSYTEADLSRHPLQVFLLVLCLVSGLPTLLGTVPAPNSIQSLIPHLMVLVWAFMLCFGSIITLIGSFWRNRVTGIIIEQIGFIWLSCAAFIYTLAIILAVGFKNGGGISAAILFGFFLASAWRAWHIQKEVNTLKRAKSTLEES